MLDIIHLHADEVDTEPTLDALLEQAESALDGRSPAAALLFTTSDHDHQRVIERVSGQFPDTAIIGGSTDGCFNALGEAMPDAILLTLFVSDDIEFSAGYGLALSDAPEAATQAAVRQALEGLSGPPSLCITTPDGNAGDLTVPVETLSGCLTPDTLVIGGTTGERKQRFVQSDSWQYCNGKALRDAIPVLLLRGELTASIGVGSGWVPLGVPLEVTHVEGSVIRTLNHRPAAEVFAEAVGLSVEEVAQHSLVEFPLAVFPDAKSDNFYLRAILSLDIESNSLRCTATIPEGTHVCTTSVDTESMIRAARSAIDSALEGLSGTPAGLFTISCAARKWILGSRISQEARALKASAEASQLTTAGFYSYGEIAPVSTLTSAHTALHSSQPWFHNETCVVLALGSP
ncbi:MAG: FIST signal transduction protein [Bradymonadia bacterium]